MKQLWVGLVVLGVLVFGVSGLVGAATFQWSFDTASNIESDTDVSNYMSMIYGSSVVANNVKIDDAGWGSGRYLTTDDASGLSIVFTNTPIIKLYGTTDGWVFDAGSQWPWQATNYDLTLTAYNQANHQVGSTLKWNTSNNAYVDIPDVTFSEPVYKLVITDDGQHDVGIDNLKVESWACAATVPEPATLLLLGAGLVGFGIARRRVRG
jgi:hypothetical protein